MTKTSIDELLKAIATVQTLKKTVSDHDESIKLIEERLDRLESLFRELTPIINALNR